ncbi:hypothetical protein [Microtetraspora malaysiensis]|uniref:hypothetical protein n=1 Tax=Microtetraspora malaysiensis TaxID=161358 RepID=UPI0008359FBC|nr:hypothetical protein [Microtetraspora malaysiensis]
MTDARIDRLVERIAPDPGPGLTPLARELLDEITSTPPVAARSSRWRPRLVWSRGIWSGGVRPRPAGVAGAIAVLLAATAWLGSAPASAALDIEREGDQYVVTVKDMFAEPAMYERELRIRGLKIELRVVPVSASMVGEVLVLDGTPTLSGVTRIKAPGECRHPFSFCSIGLRIPVKYRKQVAVFLGRPTRLGERYGLMTPIDVPGEPLHCVDYVNKTVADVEPMLRARGLKATFTAYGVKGPVPRDWYVYDGVLTAPGEVLMAVNRVPNPTPRPKNAFCPDSR